MEKMNSKIIVYQAPNLAWACVRSFLFSIAIASDVGAVAIESVDWLDHPLRHMLRTHLSEAISPQEYSFTITDNGIQTNKEIQIRVRKNFPPNVFAHFESLASQLYQWPGK